MLQACLNGDRDHPATPRTPVELASDAAACVAAGAEVLHFHPYGDDGRETFAAAPCAAAIQAVRAACPGIPLSLSTSDAIEADPETRLGLISRWTELPDLVTANQGEGGIAELCEHLLERGIGIEAGVLELSDAHAFVVSGLADRCARVLIEPLDPDPAAAVAAAAAMEAVVADAGIELEQVHHGDMAGTWAVMERAFARGHGTRAGLEDATVLPDGRPATGNTELVRAAVALRETSRSKPG